MTTKVLIVVSTLLSMVGCVIEPVEPEGRDDVEVGDADLDDDDDPAFRVAEVAEADGGHVDIDVAEAIDRGQGCFVGASSGFSTVADENACTRKCFFDHRKGAFWVPGNVHGNCKCVACACAGCAGACVPVATTSIFGPDATCECVSSSLGLDGEMRCN